MTDSTIIKEQNLLRNGGFYFKLLSIVTILLVFIYPFIESLIIKNTIVSARDVLGRNMPAGIQESTSLRSSRGTVLQLIDRTVNSKISIAIAVSEGDFLDKFLNAQYDARKVFDFKPTSTGGIQGETFQSKHKEHFFTGKFYFRGSAAAISVVRVKEAVDLKRLEEIVTKLGLTSQQ